MIRLIWIDGRLSWSLIGAVIFITLSIIILDIVWRMAKMPFYTLLIYAAAIDLATAVVAILGARLLLRGKRRQRG
jgi:hypothetical protein